MEVIILLREALRPHLGWLGARLAFVATFLIALFRVKTVNLSELAVGFIGEAMTESHYKRLQRFFAEFEVNYSEIATTVERLMKIPEPWVLSCDRTEWQYGVIDINNQFITKSYSHKTIDKRRELNIKIIPNLT